MARRRSSLRRRWQALAAIAIVMTLVASRSPLVANDLAPQPDTAPDAPPTAAT